VAQLLREKSAHANNARAGSKEKIEEEDFILRLLSCYQTPGNVKKE
jgi:hypothetical protein